jgi:hypothetical protein
LSAKTTLSAKTPGFVDFFALSDKTNAERLLCVSFWTSREGDAEEFHRYHYEMITKMLKSVLQCPPTLEIFTVGVSTAHHCQSRLKGQPGTSGFASMLGSLARFHKHPAPETDLQRMPTHGGYVNPEL